MRSIRNLYFNRRHPTFAAQMEDIRAEINRRVFSPPHLFHDNQAGSCRLRYCSGKRNLPKALPFNELEIKIPLFAQWGTDRSVYHKWICVSSHLFTDQIRIEAHALMKSQNEKGGLMAALVTSFCMRSSVRARRPRHTTAYRPDAAPTA